uniref:Uncharacterized protein n=1 Tax=Dulem virus 209 TaxID=3145686 RepID=A0AAU8B626_9VIRU
MDDKFFEELIALCAKYKEVPADSSDDSSEEVSLIPSSSDSTPVVNPSRKPLVISIISLIAVIGNYVLQFLLDYFA